jgi:amino acid transporter
VTDEKSGTGDEGSRLDRELIELLNELRVVLPGVQALFAFLLIVPFSNRFEAVTDAERVLYLVALVSSALACVVFITVPSFHRMRFRRRDKEQLIRIGNVATIVGLTLLAVSMVVAVYLITEILFGYGVGLAVAGSMGLAIVVLWWVVPLIFGPRD